MEESGPRPEAVEKFVCNSGEGAEVLRRVSVLEESPEGIRNSVLDSPDGSVHRQNREAGAVLAECSS